MKKLGVGLFAFLLVGCSFFAPDPPVPIVLSDTAVEIHVGDTYKITATSAESRSAGGQGGRSADGAGGLSGLRWKVQDSTVASVFGSESVCIVTAVAAGTTTIRASTTDSYADVVVQVLPATVLTSGIRLSKGIVPLTVGQQDQLVLQTNDANTPITWSTTGNEASDPYFQLVSNGTQALVIGKSAGTATINVQQGGNSASATVFVSASTSNTDSSSPYIISAFPTMSLTKNAETPMSVSLVGLLPQDNQATIWKESSTYSATPILSILPNGNSALVTGLTIGVTSITVTHPKVPTPYSILVRVTDAGVSQVVGLSKTSSVIPVTGQDTIIATISNAIPSDYYNIQWSVDDTSVVTVLGSGQTVTLVGAKVGRTTLRASYLTTPVRTVDILVQSASGQDNYIATQNAVTLVAGSNKDVGAQIIGNVPGSAINGLSWSSEDPGTASVFGSGASANISGLKAGITKINISHPQYPTLVASILVRVTDAGSVYTSKPISLDSSSKIIAPGQQFSLNVNIQGGLLTDYNSIVWSIDNGTASTPAVRFLGSGQTVTVLGLAAGESFITATLGSYKATCDILVQSGAGGSGAIYVVSPQSTTSINVGQQATLTASLQGGQPVDQPNLTWASSDPNVVTVFGAGQSVQVTGVASGQAVITVTHSLAAQPFKIYVQVNQPNQVLTLSQTALSTVVGTQTTLTANLTNAGVSDYNALVWSIQGVVPGQDPPILILGSGNSVIVQALTAGHVKIRVTTKSGAYQECDTYVATATGGVGGQMALTTPNYVYQLDPGKVQALTAALDGGTATQASQITWSVDDPSVCKIIGQGPQVLLNTIMAGQATITISHPALTTTQKIYISVNASNKSVSVSQTALVMSVGDQQTLSATIPSATALESASLLWASNNPAVLEVLSGGTSGVLIAKSTGQATVTVTANGCISGTVVVQVGSTTSASTFISLTPSVDTMNVGDQRTYRASIVGGTPAEQNSLVWSVAVGTNVSIVGSGSNVIITATDTGTAQINVTTPVYPTLKGTLSISVSEIDYGLTMSMSTVTMSNNQQLNVMAIGRNLTATILSTAQWGTVSNAGGVTLSPSGLNAIISSGNTTGISQVFCRVKLPDNSTLETTMLVNVQSPVNTSVTKYFSSASSIVSMNTAQSQNLSVTYNNAQQTDYGYIAWSVMPDANNTNVISLLGNRDSAAITALKAGTATILVSDSRGGVNQLSIVVNVKDPSQTITLSPTTVTVKQGDQINITTNIPGGLDSDYASVTYKVVYLDNGVVRKDGSGNIVVNPTAVISSINGRTVTVSAQNPSSNTYIMAYLPGGQSKASYASLTINQNAFIQLAQTSVNLKRFGTAAETSATIPISSYPTTGILQVQSTNPGVVFASINDDGQGNRSLAINANNNGTTTITVSAATGNSATFTATVSSTAGLKWVSTQQGVISTQPGQTTVLKYNLMPYDASVTIPSIQGVSISSPAAISATYADGSKDYSVNVTPVSEGDFNLSITHGTSSNLSLGVELQATYSDASVISLIQNTITVPSSGYFVSGASAGVLSAMSSFSVDTGSPNSNTQKLVLLRNTAATIATVLQGANAANLNNPTLSQSFTWAPYNATDVSGPRMLAAVNASNVETLSYNLSQGTDHIDASSKFLGTFSVNVLHGYNRTKNTKVSYNIYGTSMFAGIVSTDLTASGAGYQALTVAPGATSTFQITIFPSTASLSFSTTTPSYMSVSSTSQVSAGGKKYTVSVVGNTEGSGVIQVSPDATSAQFFSVGDIPVNVTYGQLTLSAPGLTQNSVNDYTFASVEPGTPTYTNFTLSPSNATIQWAASDAKLVIDPARNDGQSIIGVSQATHEGNYTLVGTISAPGTSRKATVTLNVPVWYTRESYVSKIGFSTGQMYTNDIAPQEKYTVTPGDGLSYYNSKLSTDVITPGADGSLPGVASLLTGSQGPVSENAVWPSRNAKAQRILQSLLPIYYLKTTSTTHTDGVRAELQAFPDTRTITAAGFNSTVASAFYGSNVPSVIDEWKNNPRGADFYVTEYAATGRRYGITLPSGSSVKSIQILRSSVTANPSSNIPLAAYTSLPDGLANLEGMNEIAFLVNVFFRKTAEGDWFTYNEGSTVVNNNLADSGKVLPTRATYDTGLGEALGWAFTRKQFGQFVPRTYATPSSSFRVNSESGGSYYVVWGRSYITPSDMTVGPGGFIYILITRQDNSVIPILIRVIRTGATPSSNWSGISFWNSWNDNGSYVISAMGPFMWNRAQGNYQMNTWLVYYD